MRICPGCGETCAHAWCGFCERVLDPKYEYFPRVEPAEVAAALGATVIGRRCAFGECDDPACYFCVVMPVRFRVVVCGREVDAGPKHGRRPCRLVRGPTGLCKPSTRRRVEESGEDAWWTPERR